MSPLPCAASPARYFACRTASGTFLSRGGGVRRVTTVPEAVLQAKYRAGLAAHGKGDMAAAESVYREILAAMPESFHALHMLGVLVAQRDDLEESEQLIAAAAMSPL